MNPSGGKQTTLLETLSARLKDLRTSEKAVAEVILADPIHAMDLNMAGLADAANVSEPTVMRFCYAIGFDGFRPFKIALAQTIALGLPVTFSAIDQADTPEELIEKVFSHTMSSLDRARKRLSLSSVSEAVEILSSCSEILFIGAGASGIVAQDAQQKFPLFGVPCQAPADFHQQFIAASMSKPGAAAVAFSNTGQTRSTLSVAREAKTAGATLISVTGDDGPLSELADIDIRLSTFEDTDYYTPTVSRLAGLVVVDILATAVAIRGGEAGLEHVRVMKERLAQMRG
jgi:RpiR family carbohydrate utilization transcriptional regulator